MIDPHSLGTRLVHRDNLMLPLLSVLSLIWITSISNPAHAADIAILKSAELPYYEQAVLGFKGGLPTTTKVK